MIVWCKIPIGCFHGLLVVVMILHIAGETIERSINLDDVPVGGRALNHKSFHLVELQAETGLLYRKWPTLMRIKREQVICCVL